MSEKLRPWRRSARVLSHLAATPAVLATFGAAATLVVAAPTFAQQGAPLTLDSALTRAIETDPGLQAAFAGVDAARGDLRQARIRPNPDLSVEVENFNGPGELRGLQGAETTLALSQEVELGGQRRARINLADRELHGAELDRVLAGLDLLREVQTAYFEALAAQHKVVIARERLATAEELNQSVARRVAAARDPLMAGARAEAGLAEARVALARAEAEAQSARARLATYFGGDDGFSLASAALDLPTPDGHGHDTLGDASPDLARLAAERERAAAAVRVERSLAWQNPTLSLGYRRFEDRDGDGALVAGFSIPLGVFDRNQGARARAEADRRRAEFQLEAGRRALAREYATLQRAMTADAAAVRASEGSVIPQAERALALAQDGYNRGAFSYLDVLDAQRALTDAREARVEALLSYHTNEAALDRLTARFAALLPGEEIHR